MYQKHFTVTTVWGAANLNYSIYCQAVQPLTAQKPNLKEKKKILAKKVLKPFLQDKTVSAVREFQQMNLSKELTVPWQKTVQVATPETFRKHVRQTDS